MTVLSMVGFPQKCAIIFEENIRKKKQKNQREILDVSFMLLFKLMLLVKSTFVIIICPWFLVLIIVKTKREPMKTIF